MNTYLISYDLLQPGRDYTSLHNHIKSYGSWAKPLESVWLIKTDLNSEAVRDSARLHMDANDKIFVIDVTQRIVAWYNLPQDVSNWIRNNL